MSNVLNDLQRIRLVLDHGPTDTTQKLILVGLIDRMNDEGVCWPSLADIAHRAGVKPRAARYQTAALERDGWVTRHVRHGKKTNLFAVNIAKIDTLESGNPLPDKEGSDRQPIAAVTGNPLHFDRQPIAAGNTHEAIKEEKDPWFPSRDNGQVSTRASERRDPEIDELVQELEPKGIDAFIAELAASKAVPS